MPPVSHYMIKVQTFLQACDRLPPPIKTSYQPGHLPSLDLSSLYALRLTKDPNLLQTDSEDSDQTGHMLRLFWDFAGEQRSVCWFGMLWLIYAYESSLCTKWVAKAKSKDWSVIVFPTPLPTCLMSISAVSVQTSRNVTAPSTLPRWDSIFTSDYQEKRKLAY